MMWVGGLGEGRGGRSGGTIPGRSSQPRNPQPFGLQGGHGPQPPLSDKEREVSIAIAELERIQVIASVQLGGPGSTGYRMLVYAL